MRQQARGKLFGDLRHEITVTGLGNRQDRRLFTRVAKDDAPRAGFAAHSNERHHEDVGRVGKSNGEPFTARQGAPCLIGTQSADDVARVHGTAATSVA
jgi:hypothetical protein